MTPAPSRRSVQSLKRARWFARIPTVLVCTGVLGLAIVGAVEASKGAPEFPGVSVPDVAAKQQVESFAVMCARLYMTWDSRRPDIYERSLEPCVGRGDLDSSLGFEIPARGFQDVWWAQPVQLQEVTASDSLVTVAVKTQRQDLRFLSLPIRRYPNRGVGLAGYPAFVGRPNFVPAKSDDGEAVDDDGLEAVAARVLENYLAGDVKNLRADLAPDATISLPAQRFQLEDRPLSFTWLVPNEFLAVVIRARGEQGEISTLRYELRVTRKSGRWFVSRIQVNPNQMEGVPS